MAGESNAQQALDLARAEARALADQLRQARADLHRLGITDQNRALACAAISGGMGLVIGVLVGLSIRK
jgi:hypothetical protein